MEVNQSYESYLNCLSEVIELLGNEAALQDENAKDERNAVSAFESNYIRCSEELQQAKTAVQAQYGSVWESCTQFAGLKRPREQRPAPIKIPWREAVLIQEQAASRIREWFKSKSEQAYLEHQIKAREETAKKASLAAARAEAARKKEMEARQAEEKQAEALIEAMKRKHREKN